MKNLSYADRRSFVSLRMTVSTENWRGSKVMFCYFTNQKNSCLCTFVLLRLRAYHLLNYNDYRKGATGFDGGLREPSCMPWRCHHVKRQHKTQTPTTNWHSQLNKAVRFSERVCGSEPSVDKQAGLEGFPSTFRQDSEGWDDGQPSYRRS